MNAHSAEPSGTTVLVVAGGKGGTGVSLVATLLALAVAGEGRRVLLVDAVGRGHALHHRLGVQPAATEEAVPVTETLALRAGSAGADPAADTAGAELVVVDAGSTLGAVLAACDVATRLVLVATEDRIAMAATHALLKAADARRPALPVDVVVNRATERAALAVHDHLATAAERFLDRPVGFAGAIPDDPCLEGGLGAGMTVQDAAAGSPAALAAHAAGLQLLEPHTEAAPRSRAARETVPPDGGALRSYARNA